MKRFLLSITLTLLFALYVAYERFFGLPIVPSFFLPDPTTISTVDKGVPLTLGEIPLEQVQYRDGEYIGDSVFVYYGNVQVKAVITNGVLTSVQFLEFPRERTTSQQINHQATPLLAQEAISIQSAHVDGVTGASATSAGFKQSLASALAQAIE